jgi:hypothetical protein
MPEELRFYDNSYGIYSLARGNVNSRPFETDRLAANQEAP